MRYDKKTDGFTTTKKITEKWIEFAKHHKHEDKSNDSVGKAIAKLFKIKGSKNEVGDRGYNHLFITKNHPPLKKSTKEITIKTQNIIKDQPEIGCDGLCDPKCGICTEEQYDKDMQELYED